MKFFTVHENAVRRDPDERILFVKEGMCWSAFALPVLWLLYKRAWLGLPLYAALALVLVGLLQASGLPPALVSYSAGAFFMGCPAFLLSAPHPALAAFGLLFAALCGYEANDIHRFMLARRGYRVVGVVSGKTQIEAEQAYFAQHGIPEPSPGAAQGPWGPASGGGPGGDAAARRAGLGARASEPILGLFPGADRRG